jgi:hypothetical protein
MLRKRVDIADIVPIWNAPRGLPLLDGELAHALA